MSTVTLDAARPCQVPETTLVRNKNKMIQRRRGRKKNYFDEKRSLASLNVYRAWQTKRGILCTVLPTNETATKEEKDTTRKRRVYTYI